MPELPEVEVTKQSLEPVITNQVITQFELRQPKLRWLVDDHLIHSLPNATIQSVSRRAKYLIVQLQHKTQWGYLLIHLGMSGSLRICDHDKEVAKHEHWILHLKDLQLRYNDPRRFGSLHYCTDLQQHNLLNQLGVEPLTPQFNGCYLYQKSRKRVCSIKQLLMNAHIVVGIGNIYANESLFLAKIHPQSTANMLTENKYQKLVTTVQSVLQNAIKCGGSSLKDFKNSQGKMGYFQLQTQVYGRQGQPCQTCGQTLTAIRQNQRITVFCPSCQTLYQ